jgi:arylsulfatase A-like enzyme
MERYLDGWLGRLFDVLEEELEGPSFIFVTSDHGEEFGEHGDRGHGRSLYREVLSIPALLQTPEADSGRILSKLEARDFYDVLALLGRSPWNEIRGWLSARGETERMSSIFYSMETFLKRPYENYVSMRSIEARDHALVWSGYGSTVELYDMEADPGQKRNIVRERPQLAADLKNILHNRPEHWARLEPIAESEETVKMLRALGYVE